MKRKLYNHCQEFCRIRIDKIQGQINTIRESLTAESKSTAGDKHETGRAMLQLEREKLGKQLHEVEKQQQVLQRLNPDVKNVRIVLGSLVQTETATYFISIAAGKVDIESEHIFCISANSPIGQLLLGKTTNDSFVFNGGEQRVLEVI